MTNKVDIIGDKLIFQCPHCQDFVIVLKSELNCKIFRHAVYKDTYQPINPHASQAVCQQLLSSNKVYGCAKPFNVVQLPNDTYQVQVCAYI